MRIRIVRVILSVCFLAISSVGASTPESKEIQTSVNFSDLLVKGKYSLSNEAVITVEADKALDSLLSFKKDFNKRIKRSAHRLVLKQEKE